MIGHHYLCQGPDCNRTMRPGGPGPAQPRFCSDACAIASDQAAMRADDVRAKAWTEADTETDRERVERAGYPEHIDYEALILAEDEDYE